jgi:hypothetical protein
LSAGWIDKSRLAGIAPEKTGKLPLGGAWKNCLAYSLFHSKSLEKP